MWVAGIACGCLSKQRWLGVDQGVEAVAALAQAVAYYILSGHSKGQGGQRWQCDGVMAAAIVPACAHMRRPCPLPPPPPLLLPPLSCPTYEQVNAQGSTPLRPCGFSCDRCPVLGEDTLLPYQHIYTFPCTASFLACLPLQLPAGAAVRPCNCVPPCL